MNGCTGHSRHGSPRWTLAALLAAGCVIGPAAAEEKARPALAGKEWVRDVLVQIAPGPDALGGRIPGAWTSIAGSRLSVTQEQAFTGKSSLKIELRRESGGCRRITTLYFGRGELELGCRVFVPDGQAFRKLPAVAI